jgi:hypothetical protein
MVARAGLESRLQFYRKFGEEVIPHLPPLQFAFIDGSHLFDLTLVEFVLMDKKLEVGGLLSLHDMWMPSLQKLVRYVLSNRDYAIVRTFDAPKLPSPLSVKQRVKLALATAFRCVPGKARIFQEELLRPWRALQLPNMVVLRKQADDKRDWRFHHPF